MWEAEWPPEKVHVPIPRTPEYVMLCSKSDSADIIKVTDLKFYPAVSGWTQFNHRSPKREISPAGVREMQQKGSKGCGGRASQRDSKGEKALSCRGHMRELENR